MQSPGIAAQHLARGGAGPRGSCTHACRSAGSRGSSTPRPRMWGLMDAPAGGEFQFGRARTATLGGSPSLYSIAGVAPEWPPRCCELGGFPRCLPSPLNLLGLKDGTGSCFGRYMPRTKYVVLKVWGFPFRAQRKSNPSFSPYQLVNVGNLPLQRLQVFCEKGLTAPALQVCGDQMKLCVLVVGCLT